MGNSLAKDNCLGVGGDRRRKCSTQCLETSVDGPGNCLAYVKVAKKEYSLATLLLRHEVRKTPALATTATTTGGSGRVLGRIVTRSRRASPVASVRRRGTASAVPRHCTGSRMTARAADLRVHVVLGRISAIRGRQALDAAQGRRLLGTVTRRRRVSTIAGCAAGRDASEAKSRPRRALRRVAARGRVLVRV